MRTEDRKDERPFSPVGVEAVYPAPRASIDLRPSPSWVRRMLPIVWSHRAALITAWVMTVVAQLSALAVLLVIRSGVNSLVAGRNAMLRHAVVLLLALAVVQFVAGLISRNQMLRSAYGIEYDMRSGIYEHLTRLSFSFYDRVQSGQLISRANSDIRSVQMFLAWGPNMALTMVQFVVAIALMLRISPPLTLLAVIPLPAVWWVGWKMRRLIFPVSWIVQSRLADVATIVEENITGVRVVKSFAAELAQIRALAKAARSVQWAAIKQVDIRAKYSPYLQNLPGLALVIVLLYGGYLVIHHTLDVGAIFLFSGYIVRLVAPFRILGFLLVLHERARASAQRIYEIIDTVPEIQDRPGAVDLTSVRGDVEFTDVQFSYEGREPVLGGFSLHLQPGESVALVGRNGSGKSTAARLLMRFYDVGDGAVVVDGRDVRDVTQESLRAHIGIVADDAFLFSDTIHNNIAYGRPDASLDDVVRAATAAGADDFIRDLPEGYDTIIGERGYDLSGGQRQRVSIARLLLKDPAILILDEATSSVDVRTELQIFDALRRLMEGRTTLLIAHRLSTINLADRVAYLEDGRIVATGSHANLLRTEPRYARVLAQLAAREAEEAARATAVQEELKGASEARLGPDAEPAPVIEPDWRVP